MKRWMKWVGGAVALLVGAPIVFVLCGYLLPADIVLETEADLNASPEALFVLFSTVDGVDRMWAQAGADMGESFEMSHLGGPTSGVGMELGFGPAGGEILERWRLAESLPTTSVTIDVDFQIFVSHRTLTMTPTETGTLVNWRETAHIDNPAMRWMLKFSTPGAIENRQKVLQAAGKVAARAE